MQALLSENICQKKRCRRSFCRQMMLVHHWCSSNTFFAPTPSMKTLQTVPMVGRLGSDSHFTSFSISALWNIEISESKIPFSCNTEMVTGVKASLCKKGVTNIERQKNKIHSVVLGWISELFQHMHTWAHRLSLSQISSWQMELKDKFDSTQKKFLNSCI